MKMPHCDIQTGKIFDCEPRTFSYFHEEGHLVYNSQAKTSRLNLLRGIIFDLWIVFTTMALFWRIWAILSLCMALGYMILGQTEEVWCNRYARLKLKELELEDVDKT